MFARALLTNIGIVAISLMIPIHANGDGLELKENQVKRTNILYFYVDDMGWGSIGPNGQDQRKRDGKPYVRTPTINLLAQQGLNFTRGYGCFVCSPARSSQQTGFHQGHTFADRNDPDNAKKAIRKDDVSIGDALSAAGYVTGYWGKWGYGGSKDMKQPKIENVQTLPTSHGYQHVLAELHHVRAHTFFQPTLWHAPAKPGMPGGLELIPNSLAEFKGKKQYSNFPANQNSPDYPSPAYCDDAYAFATLDFVRKQGQNYNKTGQPFFGLFAAQIPHAPFGEISSLPDWDTAYRDDPKFQSLNKQAKEWAAMVTRIDGHFANILDALKDPNNDGDESDSIVDNTLVIFQSDNGGPFGKSNSELDANGGLKGVKGKIDEGGIRVPLVIRWPAKIKHDSFLKAGTSTNKVVDVTDLFPTFCEIAGVKPPTGIDGVSIAPMLTGVGVQKDREFLIHEAKNGKSIIRGNHKLIRHKETLTLYDLETDHSEQNNIAAKHPELVKELDALMLGERVEEPRGFANTYHRWTGDHKASTAVAANWSDYDYNNAGISYMTDDGPPQASWTAIIRNENQAPEIATVDSDLDLLSLEIGGTTTGTQSVSVQKGITLSARNELRIDAGGKLGLNNGTVSSLRWLEIFPGGQLEGTGEISASMINHGIIVCGSSLERSALNVRKDFLQSKSGTLVSTIADGPVPVKVAGTARLDGKLKLSFGQGYKPVSGASHKIISAKNIEGAFSNKDGMVKHENATFVIEYGKDFVSVKQK
jgi:arylsulfatase A-like enzyme